MIPSPSRGPALRPDADGVFHAASFDTAAWAVSERRAEAPPLSAQQRLLAILLLVAVCLLLVGGKVMGWEYLGLAAVGALVILFPNLVKRAEPVHYRRIRINADGVVVDRLAPLEKLDTTALLSGPSTNRQIFDWDLVTGAEWCRDGFRIQTLLERGGVLLPWVPHSLARELEQQIRTILAKHRAATHAARPSSADAAALDRLTRQAKRER